MTGIARKASRDPEDYFTVDNPRFGPWSHMWNMIKLNNKSYLCDVTWAAGSSGQYSVDLVIFERF